MCFEQEVSWVVQTNENIYENSWALGLKATQYIRLWSSDYLHIKDQDKVYYIYSCSFDEYPFILDFSFLFFFFSFFLVGFKILIEYSLNSFSNPDL